MTKDQQHQGKFMETRSHGWKARPINDADEKTVTRKKGISRGKETRAPPRLEKCVSK
ncbi:MAG: hypothetical protein ACTSWN_00980 [Promethearchaeota archaeon]